MATYKKSLKGLKLPLSSSTRAGFVLSRPSKRLGRQKDRPRFSKSLVAGLKSRRFRPSASRPKADVSSFMRVFTPCGISRLPKFWDFSGTWPNTLREDSSLSGTGAPLTGPERLRPFSRNTGRSICTSFQGMRRNLTPTSLCGTGSNTMWPMVFPRIQMTSKTILSLRPESSDDPESFSGLASGLRSCRGSGDNILSITFT